MKVVALVKKVLGLPAATKSQTGFLVALVAMITIGGKEAITHIGVLNRNEAFVCIGLGLGGFLSWLTGRLLERKPEPVIVSKVDPHSPLDAAAIDDPLAFFRSLKFWGVVLILSTAILSYLAASRRAPVVLVEAQPQVVKSIAVTNAIPVTNEVLKASFPPLELQGMVVNGAKSSAVINGRVLNIGEQIGSVVLVAVTADYATVELEGQTKWLVLKK